MFQASSCPSSGATTAAAASGLLSELGDCSAVGRRRASRPAGPTTTNSTVTTTFHGKPEAATAVVVAPDNGHEDARNMLICNLGMISNLMH